jgi:ATP-dependent DNA helicase RecG
VQILRQTQIEQSIGTPMAAIGRTNRTKFRDQVLNPLLDSGLIEMTIPDKPTSSKQRYRITEKGRVAFAAMNEGTE